MVTTLTNYPPAKPRTPKQLAHWRAHMERKARINAQNARTQNEAEKHQAIADYWARWTPKGRV